MRKLQKWMTELYHWLALLTMTFALFSEITNNNGEFLAIMAVFTLGTGILSKMEALP
jgi:hypothetical protein